MEPAPVAKSPSKLRKRRRHRLLAIGGCGTVVAALTWGLRGPPAPRVEAVLSTADAIRIDGRLFAPPATNTPFTGTIFDRYPDGALKSRSAIVAGLLEGVSEGWYTNGTLQVREHFVAGVAEGPVTKWHPNGARLSEGMARQGQLEGLFRRWHDNGALAAEVTLRGGKPDGVSRSWFPSGQQKAEVRLERGRVVHQQFWPESNLTNLAGATSPGAKPASAVPR